MALRSLQLDWVRQFGSGTPSVFSTNVPATTVGTTVLGGWFTNLFRLPPDVRVSQTLDLVITHCPAANSLVNGQAIVFQLGTTFIDSAGVRTTSSFLYTWPVPNGWLHTNTEHTLLDNGNGVSFDADFFPDQAYVAFTIARAGANANDTFAQSSQLALGAELRYTTRYPWLVTGGNWQ